MRHAFSIFLLLLILPGVTRAQARDDTTDVAMVVQMPDSVVVTATRASEDIRLTGRRVTVWTRAEIEALPVASVGGLLRTVGGVDVQRRGGFGVQSDLTLRGSTFNGVLLLLDGARINDPMTGHFLADLPVPLSEIARIEVLRGPATALYGPDALGGVIQLFTRTGLRARSMMDATGARGTAAFRAGRHGLYDGEAAARYSTARTALSAAASTQGSDGERIAGGPLRTDFRRTAATTAFARDLGAAALYGRLGFDDRRFSAYHFYTPFPSDSARETTRTFWAQLRVQNRPDARTRWRVQASAKQHDDRYVYNPQTPANAHTSRRLRIHAAANRTLTPRLSIGGGASAGVRGIESNNLGAHQDAAGGAFLRARWQPTGRLTLNASGRADYDPVYGVALTPQLQVAYNWRALTLRGGIGRAVRAPNYVERYYNTTLARPRGRSLGNPELEAERAWSTELGVDVRPGGGLQLHATAFRRVTRGLIDYAKLAPSDTVFLARNLHRVRTRGIELEARWTQPTALGRLQLAATYTGLDADLGDVPAGVQYKYALTNARHLLQGIATLRIGRTTFGLQGLWKERLRDTPWSAPSYGLLHVRVGHQVALFGQRATFSLALRNVFNTQYADLFDAPMPGRWWLLGATVHL